MNVLNKLNLEPYGYSHGPVIGFKLSGIEAGYKIDFTAIDQLLLKRKGSSSYNTTRSEIEQLDIIGGFEQTTTNGQVIEIQIKQNNFRSSDYNYGLVRPGHADLSAYQKYGANYSYQGGGQFSGRLTVLYVIAGEIARQILATKTKLKICGHVAKVGTLTDLVTDYRQVELVQNDPLPVVDQDVKIEIQAKLETLKQAGDSIGGQLDIYIYDLERNYGDDFFAGLEAKISFLLFAIPAVKAIEFGLGTEFAKVTGTQALEQLEVVCNKVISKTNYNGGINGGIANLAGPIKLSVTVKPTSTIFQQVATVKYSDGQFKPHQLTMRGRHDSFIANRAMWPMIGLLNILFLDLEMEEGC